MCIAYVFACTGMCVCEYMCARMRARVRVRVCVCVCVCVCADIAHARGWGSNWLPWSPFWQCRPRPPHNGLVCLVARPALVAPMALSTPPPPQQAHLLSRPACPMGFRCSLPPHGVMKFPAMVAFITATAAPIFRRCPSPLPRSF